MTPIIVLSVVTGALIVATAMASFPDSVVSRIGFGVVVYAIGLFTGYLKALGDNLTELEKESKADDEGFE